MVMLGLSGDATDPYYGKYAGDFSMKDFEQDPGYGFRLAEGIKALEPIGLCAWRPQLGRRR